MGIKIISPKDAKEISIYLEKMNATNKSHIGFCGEQNEEIYDSLMNDFSDLEFEDSFLVAYDQSNIVGAIGLDVDLGGAYADVWGPFVTDENLDVAQALWNKALLKIPQEIKSCSFFINKDNVFAKEFVIQNSAQYLGTDMVLSITRSLFTKEALTISEKIDKEHYDSFISLHDEVFPQTYFNSHSILKRLNGRNNLLIIKGNESKIKGYVYIEAKPEHKEGNIEYIAVSVEYRGQGVGKMLIIDALKKLFSYSSIDEITICVSCENEAAINLYKSVGFKEKYVLDSYDLAINND
ncbi:N-acetyltransferase [Metasolibacillus sp.]|uniref:GNAT family N-acetyltransferase n=1 Tax=Metasolibacillus sp. TaxID=2703680 RepID=UPI0025E1F4EF|nr:N-acetyltransferase [Metasolibacillus sp.]MCT6926135.1 GNAT family N-acetyltransferase [Metasolibacillus sp.]MCT6942341.1 GNAT family N-acetyltransferase [Metasolibacillus sp.]